MALIHIERSTADDRELVRLLKARNEASLQYNVAVQRVQVTKLDLQLHLFHRLRAGVDRAALSRAMVSAGLSRTSADNILRDATKEGQHGGA